jgi:membrane protein DedA with SNARE-associated domain
MESFLIRYGVAAVALVATVESDVTLILAGVIAHLGFFSLPAGIAAGSTGAFIGDTIVYTVGRTNTRWIQETRVYRRMGPGAESLFRRFGVGQLFAMRLFFGTRIATIILFGVRRVEFWRFALFDFLSCAAWATLLGMLGFALSNSAAWLIGEVKDVERWVACALVVTVLLFIVLRRISGKRLLRARFSASGMKR